MGQLAAIETAVLQGMSIDNAAAVYQAWAWPGGPGPAGWPLTGNVQAFLGAAGMTAMDASATVQVRPAAGQVKGVDGPDWTVVCVLLTIEAHIDDRGPDGLRLLRTDAVVAGGAAVDDRPRESAGRRTIHLAGRRAGPAGGLADLDHRRNRRRHRGR